VLTVQPAGEDDAASIRGLLAELGYPLEPEPAAAALRRVLADPGHVVLLAVDGDRALGYVNANFRLQLHHAGEVATIDALIVSAACRGEGVGARLVEEIVEIARRRGANVVEVSSNVTREAAHRFYERLGFERISYKFVLRL
jgi:GNAT superfamily N-acetyltransferase